MRNTYQSKILVGLASRNRGVLLMKNDFGEELLFLQSHTSFGLFVDCTMLTCSCRPTDRIFPAFALLYPVEQPPTNFGTPFP